MTGAKAEFVIQLGDFCQPKPANQGFLAAWNEFAGPRHHVIGNHDTDGGFKPEQTVAYYGMPARYYTFDGGGFLGVVLDGNEPGGKAKGYKRYVAATQREWMARTLAEADRPALLFIHQPLDDGRGATGGVENAAEVRAVLAEAERKRPGSILAVLSGHLHEDYLRVVDGISHVQINSASYVWLPGNAAREVYAKEEHAKFPYLRHVAPYRDPLWALATLDWARGELRIEGRATEWVGPDPWARGAGEKDYPREVVRPSVTDRTVALPGGRQV